MNPWITGWTQPKETIRNILATNPKHGFWPLVIASSLSIAFSTSYSHSIGMKNAPWMFFGVLFVATLCSSILNVYFMGWVLKITGKILGGQGSSASFRAAILWSSLPNLLFIFVWLMLLILRPESTFILNANHNTTLLINLIGLTIFCWQFYLLTGMTREVQGFSTIRSVMNLITAYFVLFVSIIIILLLVGSVYFLIFGQK